MNKIIHGNCLVEMKKMKGSSIDSIITDPPYGLKFMGKKWDYDVPSVEVFQEMLRVIKPGGFLLCFGGSRTFHRMAVNIEDAGFEIRDTIMWIYGSGFPKSFDISKGIDKKFGAEREVVGTKAGHGNNSSLSRKKQAEQGYRPDGENFGEYDGTKLAPITAPATPEAQQWDGYGTALKPAFEPIIVAMKPIDKNYVNNALTHGVAGLNIDGCRIEGSYDNSGRTKREEDSIKGNVQNCPIHKKGQKTRSGPHSQGRFPANIILDEEAGKMLDEQSGILKSGGGNKNSIRKNQESAVYHPINRHYSAESIGNDSGGASRFFYCAKASKSERNAGCEGLTNKKHVAGNYSQSPTCKDCDKTLNGTNDHSKCSGEVYYKEMKSKNTGNNHPTVKPLALMEWLVNLDLREYLCNLTKTPTGGIVLDPYGGSGTTACACVNTGRDFIVIERTAEYIPIIKSRVKYYQRQKDNKLL